MNIVIDKWVFDGNHESTKALMQLMSKIDFKDKDIVDIGCGSGILSIYAAELGARHITAFDADSRAVENTLKNAERNCFSNIEAYWLDFMQTNCKADILIANLPLQIGLFCLPKMKESINDGGLIVTSWHKENPKKELTIDFEIVDYIEGIDYDCYVLKSNK